MAEQFFIKDKDEYVRDINPVKHYIEQMSFYIHKETGKPIDECTVLVKKALNDRVAFPDIQNPIVRHYQKLSNGDKTIREIGVLNYIKDVIDDKNLLAPSFTAYKHPSVKESVISKFAVSNVALRAKVKKQMFVEKAKGNKEKAQAYDLSQKNYKQYNNALSGALVSNGSVVKNPSAHSSLTSTTRTVTSLGNASNERLLAGNRHYRNPDIVMYNIISICSDINVEDIRSTMEHYKLKYPTVQEAMECIKRSSYYYWVDTMWLAKIEAFLSKLDPEHLAAFVYTGDLYHIRLLNEDFIRGFIDELVEMHISDAPMEDILNDIKKYDDVTSILSRLINFDDLQGNKTIKMDELEEPILRKVIGTCEHVEQTLAKYSKLISTFFVTKHVPPSVAYILDMIRRTVVLSDTDSTCASYGEWVDWRYGVSGINSQGISFSAGVMTISTQAIAHTLGLLSANIGTTKENLRRLAMKNEFLWTIFCPANISKTYFASTLVQEGVIFPEYDLEYKGVQYKSANSPKAINDLIKEMMHYVITSITSKGTYSINHLLLKAYNMEKTILDYIDNKDPRIIEYFAQLNIKDKEAYAEEPHRSNYMHYLLWQEVFQDKYGAISPPPYRSVRIPLDIKNKTDQKRWLTSMEDKALASRLAHFITKYNKPEIKLICLPIDYIKTNGIPSEISRIVSHERLLNNVLAGVYLLLESLGFIKLPNQPYISAVRR